MSDLLEMGRMILASQPFSTHVGGELVQLEAGMAELAVPLSQNHLQQNGFAHGGVISYLIDNALTFAGGSVLGPNVLTQGYSVTYMRPGIGDRLVARATVLHKSRRQAVCRCDVFAVQEDEEKLCATALGTILATQD
jgi:uncharacterized protein (TIGR00369 family)